MEFLPDAVLIIISSYLIGSIPTAYLLGKLHGVNVFDVGSGNMGGTNVARSMGLGWGILTAILDAGKGMLAVALAQFIVPEPFSMRVLASAIAAGAAISGHNWSIFCRAAVSTLQPGRTFQPARGQRRCNGLRNHADGRADSGHGCYARARD